MNRSSLTGPSIIRIVPSTTSNKKVSSLKRKAKTIINSKPKIVKEVGSASNEDSKPKVVKVVGSPAIEDNKSKIVKLVETASILESKSKSVKLVETPSILDTKPKNLKLLETPSTSKLQLQSHVQDHRYEKRIVDYLNEFDILQEDDVQYMEEVEEDPPKPMFSPVHQSNDNCLSTSPQKSNKSHSQECCCACRQSLETILKQQQEILKYLMKNDHGLLPTGRLLNLLPPMPFEDVNDFLDFDESVASNENVQDQFLIKIRRLLVSHDQKSVANIMSSILTNELCRRISWTGIKNTISFGTSNMVVLITDLVQQHHDLDIDVIKSRIAEWLRRCGDRISNEIRKKKKKL